MRYSISLAVVAVATLLSLPGTARAAAMGGPPGSYLETCRNVRMDGERLSARCEKRDGGWRDTSLYDVYSCAGDIVNDNGRLVCNKQSGPPRGDYALTCRDIRVRFNSIYARCQRVDGSWGETQLDGFSRCQGPIANIDGQLRCGSGDPDGGRGWGYGPGGSYRETCRDIRAEGYRLTARCQTSDGQWYDSSLDDYNRCVGGIINDEGHLECTRPGGHTIPGGHYTETCSRIHVDGDTLRAMCQNDDGRLVWTQLNDWHECRGGIWNRDGHLRCRRNDDED